MKVIEWAVNRDELNAKMRFSACILESREAFVANGPEVSSKSCREYIIGRLKIVGGHAYDDIEIPFRQAARNGGRADMPDVRRWRQLRAENPADLPK